MTSGIAPGWRERTWMKWVFSPSSSVVNWEKRLSLASRRRQSYSSAQYWQISWIHLSGAPWLKSLTSSASGQRVLRSLAFRSASTASVTVMRDGGHRSAPLRDLAQAAHQVQKEAYKLPHLLLERHPAAP